MTRRPADGVASGLRFRAGHAGDAPWPDLVDRAIAELEPLPPGANLGLVYVTDLLAGELPGILDRLRRRTAVPHWAGCVGIGICAGQTEYIDEPALSLLVGALPEDSFRLFAFDRQHSPDLLGQPGPGGHRVAWGLVHGDPQFAEAADAVKSLAEDAQAYLVGGLASARTAPWQIAGQVVEGGISGLLFDDRIEIATGLTQGCSPIGPLRHVTASDGNIILEIDGKPAIDCFKADIGELLSRDLKRVAGLIFVGLPIAGSDQADYLVRNLVALDPSHGWLAVAGTITPGDPLLFCRRDRASASADFDRMLAGLKRRMKRPPAAGIYVSCIGRGPGFFGADDSEVKRIAAALGDFPLAGFFGNGEIACDRIYGYTGVLTLFL